MKIPVGRPMLRRTILSMLDAVRVEHASAEEALAFYDVSAEYSHGWTYPQEPGFKALVHQHGVLKAFQVQWGLRLAESPDWAGVAPPSKAGDSLNGHTSSGRQHWAIQKGGHVTTVTCRPVPGEEPTKEWAARLTLPVSVTRDGRLMAAIVRPIDIATYAYAANGARGLHEAVILARRGGSLEVAFHLEGVDEKSTALWRHVPQEDQVRAAIARWQETQRKAEAERFWQETVERLRA